jgi:predicted transcriptional regulator
MTQEEFMDVLAMKRAGMTFTEIGAQTGYHPATISKWCQGGWPAGGPHGRRFGPCGRPAVG